MPRQHSVWNKFSNVQKATESFKERGCTNGGRREQCLLLSTTEKEKVASELTKEKDGLEAVVCSVKDGPRYIFKACTNGDIALIREIVRKFPDRLNLADPKGRTPLHHAAIHDQPDVIRTLHCLCADMKAVDSAGYNAVHAACFHGHVRALNALLTLETSADLVEPNRLNNEKTPPLVTAVIKNFPEIVKELATTGNPAADMNVTDRIGANGLHHACKLNRPECAKLLIEYGTRMCSPCNNGFFPVHLAAKYASSETLEILLVACEAKGYTRDRVLSFLDNELASPLHSAVVSGDIRAVRACLDHGARLEALQEDNANAFHLACNQGMLEMVQLMFEKYSEKNPGKKGEILGAKDVLGMTPLHRAAMFDHPTVCQYLIDQGCIVDDADKEGRTAILLAAEKGGKASIEVLLMSEPNLRVRDACSRNLLHFLIRHGKALKGVLRSVAEKEIILIDEKDQHGCTPLHMASELGDVDLLDMLLQLGAKTSAKDLIEQSPLHFAARYGRRNTVSHLLNFCSVSIINEMDSTGQTPLHVACANGQTPVVELMLAKGALVHRDFAGKTALHLAAENGHIETIKLLLSYHKNILDTKDKAKNTALHLATGNNQEFTVTMLLTEGAEFGHNGEDKTPLDIATDRRYVPSAQAIARHQRWDEIARVKTRIYRCPFLGLIEHLPEAAKTVLDRCHTSSYDNGKNTNDNSQLKDPKDYSETFNFVYMDPPVDDKTTLPLRSLNRMVQHDRIDLLSHSVSLAYLRMKWQAYGMLFFTLNLIMYLLFLASLTGVLLKIHYVVKEEPKPILTAAATTTTTTTGLVGQNSTNADDLNNENIIIKLNDSTRAAKYGKASHNELEPVLTITNEMYTVLIFLMAFNLLNVAKEIVQMYQQKIEYFWDAVNYIEWALYLSSLAFVIPLVFLGELGSFWECGAVAAFLAWFNLLLYFQRVDSVGLYVVMFLQICSTIIRVCLVFTTLFLGFGLTFYILFGNKVVRGYGDFVTSTVHSIMMMMGDWNYQTLFIQSSLSDPLPYPALSTIFLILFIVMMPILFINLLIGLAVGDIEMVQKDARLKRLAMQVEYHTKLEEKLPKWFLLRVNKKEMTVYPRAVCGGSLMRLGIGGEIKLGTPTGMEAADIHEEAVAYKRNMNDRLSGMEKKMKSQEQMLRLILAKMEINTELD